MILAIKIKMEQSFAVLHLRSLSILFNNCSQIQQYQGKLFSVYNCMYNRLPYGRFYSIKKTRKYFADVDMSTFHSSYSCCQVLFLYDDVYEITGVPDFLLFNRRACNVSDNSNSKV